MMSAVSLAVPCFATCADAESDLRNADVLAALGD